MANSVIQAIIKRTTVTVTTDGYGQISYSALGTSENRCLSAAVDGVNNYNYSLVKCGDRGFRCYSTSGNGGLTNENLVVNTQMDVIVFTY